HLRGSDKRLSGHLAYRARQFHSRGATAEVSTPGGRPGARAQAAALRVAVQLPEPHDVREPGVVPGGDWEPQPDPTRWHIGPAAGAEAHHDWFASGFHLDWLLKRDPDNPELLHRRAEANAGFLDKRASHYAQLHNWDAAIADWQQALRQHPDETQ